MCCCHGWCAANGPANGKALGLIIPLCCAVLLLCRFTGSSVASSWFEGRLWGAVMSLRPQRMLASRRNRGDDSPVLVPRMYRIWLRAQQMCASACVRRGQVEGQESGEGGCLRGKGPAAMQYLLYHSQEQVAKYSAAQQGSTCTGHGLEEQQLPQQTSAGTWLGNIFHTVNPHLHPCWPQKPLRTCCPYLPMIVARNIMLPVLRRVPQSE